MVWSTENKRLSENKIISDLNKTSISHSVPSRFRDYYTRQGITIVVVRGGNYWV